MYNRNHIEFIWKEVLFYISTYNEEQGKVRKMISLAHSSISKQLKLKFKGLNKVRTAIIKITKKTKSSGRETYAISHLNLTNIHSEVSKTLIYEQASYPI